MQPLFDHNLRRVDIQNTDLGRQDQHVVARDHITGRTQAVSVKHRPHNIPIREENGCRAVPRFHHRRIILVKILFLLRHGLIVLPRFRNRDHHRQRQRHSAHHKEFQRIVKHRRIGTGSADCRQNLMQMPR